ncbi:MAG: hypothetical protein QOG90_707, partial [Actinomycetota bacterium]
TQPPPTTATTEPPPTTADPCGPYPYNGSTEDQDAWKKCEGVPDR